MSFNLFKGQKRGARRTFLRFILYIGNQAKRKNFGNNFDISKVAAASSAGELDLLLSSFT